MTEPLDICIDVSDAQKVIDWPAVAGAGIRIAFVKATEGATFTAKTFERNRTQAAAAGIVVIPYHFLRHDDPQGQIRHFRAVTGLDAGMPFALDLEGRASQTASARDAEMIGEELALVAGRPPIGYWGLPGSTPVAPTRKMLAWPRWIPRYPVVGGQQLGGAAGEGHREPERPLVHRRRRRSPGPAIRAIHRLGPRARHSGRGRSVRRVLPECRGCCRLVPRERCRGGLTMHKVDQTRFYAAGVSRGNCQQAAVASILGLPLEEVPNFAEAESFWSSFHAFLKERGYIVVELPGNRVPECYYLAYGPAARGARHACIYRAGKLVHDPHPDRTGLINVEQINLIVPVEIGLGVVR
jgi:hypothetical protein